ncbi:hypothetical protein [Bradyrhizobium sp. S3.7.6]
MTWGWVVLIAILSAWGGCLSGVFVMLMFQNAKRLDDDDDRICGRSMSEFEYKELDQHLRERGIL